MIAAVVVTAHAHRELVRAAVAAFVLVCLLPVVWFLLAFLAGRS